MTELVLWARARLDVQLLGVISSPDGPFPAPSMVASGLGAGFGSGTVKTPSLAGTSAGAGSGAGTLTAIVQSMTGAGSGTGTGAGTVSASVVSMVGVGAGTGFGTGSIGSTDLSQYSYLANRDGGYVQAPLAALKV